MFMYTSFAIVLAAIIAVILSTGATADNSGIDRGRGNAIGNLGEESIEAHIYWTNQVTDAFKALHPEESDKNNDDEEPIQQRYLKKHKSSKNRNESKNTSSSGDKNRYKKLYEAYEAKSKSRAYPASSQW